MGDNDFLPPPSPPQGEYYRGKPNNKPPYLLGLLGIIPFLGAVAGLVLVLLGIIKYKNVWLALVGIADILFTLAIFGSFYLMKPSSVQINKAFASTDTIALNSLVKEIEFYKLQNGTYPDSLGQLDTKENFTSTSDPILIASNNKNNKFNYHKIGGKYTLFSSGIDQKPNTKDDIYPTLKIDTNKMGLIKPKVGL